VRDATEKRCALVFSSSIQSVREATDDELVSRLRLGEARAFAELHRRHHSAAVDAARRTMEGEADVDDIVQDAFLTLWQKRRDLPYGAQIRQWIASTSRFHALNTRRTGLRRTAAEESDPLRRAAIEPEQWVALEAKLSAINRVLAAVSPLDRAAFERCVVDGLLYKQAASVLGISHPAVRNRLGRMRRELAAEISRED
jgi:RNA polymerase sigma-70 factor (ECF subfamily)